MQKISLILLLFVTCIGQAQYTLIPDPNFEQALIDLGIDDDGLNGQFLTANAIGVVNLNLDDKNISDLTGIEAFVDLDQLFAASNILDTIDLSLLPSDLFTLDLYDNELSNIDLGPTPNIVNLYLGGNNLTSIDASNMTSLFIFHLSYQNVTSLNLTNCTNLFSLGCVETALQTIDLSDCTNLAFLTCYDSQIASLDFSNNIEIEEITSFNTPLTSINLPNNPILEYLSVSYTLLTDLDVSNCPGLTILNFYDTAISQIDLSNNIALERLACVNSQLTSLDVSGSPNLLELWCRNNNIGGSIDFHNNPVLDDVSLDNNLLEAIDFSQNPLLTYVGVEENPNLEFVNMKNGFNENIIAFVGIDCPELSCVVVDDPTANNDNFFIDANTTLVANVEDCVLAINDYSLQDNVSIHPNPARSTVSIDNHTQATILSIRLYDATGRLVLVEKDYVYEIDISLLNSGLYFLNVETEEGRMVKKVVKH